MNIQAALLRHRLWLYFVVALGLFVGYMTYQTAPLYLAAGVVSIVAMMAGVFVNKPPDRLPWFLLAAGTFLWVAGDLTWFRAGPDGPVSYPSVTDYIYLLGYPPIVASLALLLWQRSTRGAMVILDAATITTGAGVVVWMKGIAPYFESQSSAGVAVSVAYLLLDLLLVGLAVRLVLTHRRRSVSSGLLSVGLLALVLSDLASYLFAVDWPIFWSLLDAGWLISYLSMGAAALHPSMARTSPRKVERRRTPSAVSFVVMAVGGLIAPLTLLPHILETNEMILLGPLVGGALFFLLTLLRMRLLFGRLESANRTLSRQGERLVEAEERYRTLVEQSPAVSYVMSVGHEVRLLYVSPQIKEILGYEPSEVIDDPTTWVGKVHPDDLATLFDPGPSDSPDRHDKTLRFIAKDGKVVWAANRASLIKDGPDERLWQGIFFDISERFRIQELEGALEREKEAVIKLQAVDEMKNTFLQAVSHELRTPLTSIKGMAATLDLHSKVLPMEEIGDLAARINANAGRLEALLGDLLDVDRLSRGVFVPQRAETDIGAIFERAGLSLGQSISQSITFQCERVDIWTDRSKVERIAENLIANAIKHTPPDCSIWITVRPEPGGVLVAVEDSGNGIKDEVKELIFEPFGQWDSEQSHAQGLGLGLSLVRRFAELLDGRAWVEDRPGKGASFKVFLPSRPASTEVDFADSPQTVSG